MSTGFNNLPTFKYYPGASLPSKENEIFRQSDLTCQICKTATGWAYAGLIYGGWDEEYDDVDLEAGICPWCIANGNAGKKHKAIFNPVGTVKLSFFFPARSMHHNHLGDDEGVPKVVFQTIRELTPGIRSRQESKWFFHCNDAGIYLGRVGKAELDNYGEAATNVIKQGIAKMFRTDDQDELARLLSQLNRQEGPSAYLFRCTRCCIYGGFSDLG